MFGDSKMLISTLARWKNRMATTSLSALSLLVSACGSGDRPANEPAMGAASEGVTITNGQIAITPDRSCAELTGMDLSAIGGDGSEVVSAKLASHQSVPVCQVEGLLQPSIKFRLLLPTETWTGRYLQLGCGGLCGMIDTRVLHADGCARLGDGEFAIAATDMGHTGRTAQFGNDPQKRIDFAYRAVHLTAESSKAVIERFYGRPADYAYYTGCSDGGRAGLAAAQRYPDDFDGIIAGAPVMNFQVQNTFDHTWRAVSNTNENGQPILTADRLPLIHDAAIAECDLIDGMADRLISDPRLCEFDPRTIVCESGDVEANCLSAQEAEAAYKIYRGPYDDAGELAFSLGGPQAGSELSWQGVFVPGGGRPFLFSELIARDVLGNLAFEVNPEPGFSIQDFEFSLDSFERIRPMHSLYGATNPDLNQFSASGGKLIMWHGWSDPHISPINTLAYHKAVQDFMGSAQTDAFMKLYLMPGMYHCMGGDGPSSFDLLTPLMAWVEDGVAPDAIATVQTGTEASSQNARPVFPYPAIAQAVTPANEMATWEYVAVDGYIGPDRYEWTGEDFFSPSITKACSVVDDQMECVGLN